MFHQLLKPTPERTSQVRTIFRIFLGAGLLFAGIGHLTFQREEFLAQVPNWVSVDGDLVVVWSGILEILLGAALVFVSRYRVLIGWIVAVFFVAIFPGNIAQYQNGIDAFGLNTDQDRFIRLFFQPLLVGWALWSTGAWCALRTAQRSDG